VRQHKNLKKMKRFFTIFGLLALIGLSGVLNAQIPTTGLVAKYSFTGNTNDESGNGFNASVVNGAVLTTDRFGNSTSAYYFDGNNDYLTSTIGSQTILTVSLWYNSFYPINWYPRIFGIDNIEFLSMAGNHQAFINNNNVGHLGGYPDGMNSIPCIPTFETWHHVVIIHDHSTGRHEIYIDNSLCNTGTTSNFPVIPNGTTTIGNTTTGTSSDGGAGFKGSIDDIRVYNRALNTSEINSLFTENLCSDMVINDTTTYFVSSQEFQSLSPKTVFENTDSLTSQIGGCDSIVHHYSKFVYEPTYCTDTTYISVTDTLIINAGLTGITPPNNMNTLKVYPNPTSTHIYINNGDYTLMNGYTISIENSLSQVVFTSLINQAEFYVDLSTWTGNGLYIVKIIDNSSNVIETKKIIIQ